MLIDSDSATLDPTHAYKLLIGSIIPRAVGWISSISKDGIANLEPISLFTGAGRKPPMVCLNMQPRSDGVTLKDAFVNMRDNGEFVVNMVTLEQGRKSAVVALGKQYLSGFIAWIFWCLVHVLFSYRLSEQGRRDVRVAVELLDATTQRAVGLRRRAET